MKKKIIVFNPSIEEGGVEKNLYIISNYLIKKNIEVNILTCNKNKKKFFNKSVKFISPNSDFWSFRGRLIKYIICTFILFLNLIKNKSNIIIFSFQANIIAIVLSKIFKTRIIVRANSAPSGWSKNYLKRMVYSFLINLADCIIVNSYEFKKDFKKLFNVSTQCIYNPFDKKNLNFKNKKKVKDKFIKIISIGRLTKQKDHITLLKAARLIKPDLKIQILIVGKGSEYKNLINYIERFNLKSKIKLLGYKHKPYSYILNSDIFVLTSRYEGLPNVLLEAQYLKKYIISSNCPTGPKEILLNGKAGDLFDVGNYKKLASIINNYPHNKKQILNKINYGFKNFYRFDYFKNCEKYYDIILKNF